MPGRRSSASMAWRGSNRSPPPRGCTGSAWMRRRRPRRASSGPWSRRALPCTRSSPSGATSRLSSRRRPGRWRMRELFVTAARVARKEFRGFFATPAAYLFLGAYLAATLFFFFWAEAFFARNIADVRPLFQWMPLLLIFLVSALTMRAWSEERRAGTLESLLTAPVAPVALVLGKLAAAMGLVALALALTLPLPITVSLIGPLDWGPVVGGYVATLFLAAAYVAIGLYMSSRTDNPVVALILTAVVCGVFYLVGSNTLTSLFGHQVGGVLALLGSGTRFESITRGVLDLRDIYYYLSIVGVFVVLNLYTLERLRWAGNPASSRHRAWKAAAALAAANFVAA